MREFPEKRGESSKPSEERPGFIDPELLEGEIEGLLRELEPYAALRYKLSPEEQKKFIEVMGNSQGKAEDENADSLLRAKKDLEDLLTLMKARASTGMEEN